ncbi:hypothetical protein [Synoicihabitans lomoniglobus]|uniref:Uncharacterized protein n=1 Tax=Synoicihabitans lomoniglobus TaxID=2909285 RepID=A0AAE9ZVC4_9BACT|nr:hypothetical protein [Opitutaceae bacterium LMO-M01]WED63764.1 hypothetical protein PXH66_15615 [Opitutaceae bacterium LMO-M01]
MPLDPHAQFEQHVLENLEFSPTGEVPHTPAHQEALAHLIAAHQVYPSADHAHGHVSVRTLAALPAFYAHNLEAVIKGEVAEADLESDESIFDRYVASLPASLREAAEVSRSLAVGRRLLHRAKHDGEIVHDPVHSLFLIPGCGPHPGLPGNYLHGSIFQDHIDDLAGAWALHVHDRDDGAATCEVPTREAALEKLEELLASAPFLLSELEALDFQMN